MNKSSEQTGIDLISYRTRLRKQVCETLNSIEIDENNLHDKALVNQLKNHLENINNIMKDEYEEDGLTSVFKILKNALERFLNFEKEKNILIIKKEILEIFDMQEKDFNIVFTKDFHCKIKKVLSKIDDSPFRNEFESLFGVLKDRLEKISRRFIKPDSLNFAFIEKTAEFSNCLEKSLMLDEDKGVSSIDLNKSSSSVEKGVSSIEQNNTDGLNAVQIKVSINTDAVKLDRSFKNNVRSYGSMMKFKPIKCSWFAIDQREEQNLNDKYPWISYCIYDLPLRVKRYLITSTINVIPYQTYKVYPETNYQNYVLLFDNENEFREFIIRNSNYHNEFGIDYSKLMNLFSGLGFKDEFWDVPSVCIWNFNCVLEEERPKVVIVDRENSSFTLEKLWHYILNVKRRKA